MSSFDAQKYWEDRHEATTGLEGVGYLGLKGYNEWMYRLRRRVFHRALRPYAGTIAGSRVIDVGSGTGFYLDCWSRYRPTELVGSDFSKVACDRLEQTRRGARIVQLDITSTSPADFDALGQFDYLSVVDVLYHLIDDGAYQQALHNVARLLRPGGVMVFTENFLQHRARFANEWSVARELTEIEGMLDVAGLSLHQRAPWFVLMNGPVDSDDRFLRAHWNLVRRVSGRSRLAGNLLGAAEFPAEVLLTKLFRESPTSEIAIAVRR